MAAAIQPTIGILIIAVLTAAHATRALVANAPNEAEAMPENVAEAVPPVTNERANAPSPLRALNIPAVAKRTSAMVARPILPIKPSDIMLVADSVPFISAKLTAAERTQPTTFAHIPAQLSAIIEPMPLAIKVNNGNNWAIGTAALDIAPAQSVKSPVA